MDPIPIKAPVTVWLERADRIAARLQKITGDDTKKYLHHIVEEFLGNRKRQHRCSGQTNADESTQSGALFKESVPIRRQ